MKFSLIMATYGRKSEIKDFLDSLLIQENFNLNEVEVIVVDQNDLIILDDLFDSYRNKLDIIHIKSEKKGLSLNRNIGLEIAKGEYIAFPDDDCIYYPDTLYRVDANFSKNLDVDIFLGRIIDRATNKNIIRTWKDSVYSINEKNFFFSYSSITIFSRKNSLKFDEELGVGTFFGSYEDADYIWQALNNGKKIVYMPNIDVWHPEPKEQIVNYNKIYSYGLGFGALIAKHMSFPAIWLFIQSTGYHFIKLLVNLVKFNKQEMKKSWLSFTSRFKGLYLYATK